MDKFGEKGNNKEAALKSSDFIFDCVYYKCHKLNLNSGGSYIDSPD